jgi:hypothetical protein
MTLKNNNLLGLILIAVGALAILGNIGIFGGLSTMLFAAGMGLGGVYLIRQYLRQKQSLWTSIVGFTLLGLALASLTGAMSGFYFFAMIGAGFITIYRKEPKQWWAVIPGGVLWTLATVAGSEAMFPRWDAAPLFFAGLATIFGYLYTHGKSWAIFPAAALAIVAFLNLSFSGGWIVPTLLIAAGIYVINRKKPTATAQEPYQTTLATHDVISKDVLVKKLDTLEEVSSSSGPQALTPPETNNS